QRAEQRAENEREQHGEDSDLQVGAAAVEQPGPDVPAELVGPEPVRRARALQRGQQVLLHRAVPADHRREHGQQYQGRGEAGAGHEGRCPGRPGGERRPAADRRLVVVGERCPGRRRRAHRSLTLGSSWAAVRSVSRLIRTTAIAYTMVTPWTTGKSRTPIAFSIRLPSPFRSKTRSITTVLPIR